MRDLDARDLSKHATIELLLAERTIFADNEVDLPSRTRLDQTEHRSRAKRFLSVTDIEAIAIYPINQQLD